MKIPLPRAATVPSRSGISLASTASDIPSYENARLSPAIAENRVAESAFQSTPHPEDSNLNMIPEQLSSTYRPLPVWLKVFVGVLATGITTLPSWRKHTLLTIFRRAPHLTVWLANWVSHHYGSLVMGIFPWSRFVRFLAKTLLIYLVMLTVVQESIPKLRPTRIATADLAAKYHLPSKLSRYDYPTGANETGCRVHWIQMEPSPDDDSTVTRRFDAVYVNHGFGASSLSWLPVFPSLSHKVARGAVMGHDAPGFGFTDRLMNDVRFYSIENSAALGATLLRSSGILRNETASNVLLLGHSMGCLTTLYMATQLDPAVELHIVLVAPAFGLLPAGIRRVRRWWGPLPVVATSAACYGLRRLVGRSNFWLNGLKVAWGNPKRLKGSDGLRYQWPSIGKGWERGLINFAHIQGSGLTLGRYANEQELLRDVLNMPNVRGIHVISGSSDRIMRSKRIRQFLSGFPNITVTEIDGLGHNPFEEDCDLFMEALQVVLP
jgi:pimeloyl-ACP methyl ester carboxylesterase